MRLLMTVTMCALICALSRNRAGLSILSQGLWDTWRAASQVSYLVSCAFSVSLFQVLPGSKSMRHVIYFGDSGRRQKYAFCRPNIVPLLMGHTKHPVFAIVPNLVSVQLHGLLNSPSVLEIDNCCNSWSISLVTRQVLEDSTRKSAASCFCILHRLFQR